MFFYHLGSIYILQAIVENILRTYNKRLHDDQITVLLDKKGSSNPLWLTLACEELRVYGVFETLTDKIHELPDELIRYASILCSIRFFYRNKVYKNIRLQCQKN